MTSPAEEPCWPPFASDLFLDALRHVYAPNATKALVTCEGVVVRTLLQGRSRALSGFYPFPFYLEPLLENQIEGEVRPVRYLRDVVTGVAEADSLAFQGRGVAPLIDWTAVESWDRYLEERQSPPGVDSVGTVMRKQRRLERELGPTRLVLMDERANVFEQLIRWKSAQYRRTGAIDRLSVKQNVDFYRELRRTGFFVTTSFWAGEHLLGGKIGVRMGGRHISRLTVYNTEFAHLSAGSVMELETVRASFEAGDSEFDFLMGREAYKFTYATHMRVIGDLGVEPRIESAVRTIRGRLGRSVAGKPGYSLYRGVARWATGVAGRVKRG